MYNDELLKKNFDAVFFFILCSFIMSHFTVEIRDRKYWEKRVLPYIVEPYGGMDRHIYSDKFRGIRGLIIEDDYQVFCNISQLSEEEAKEAAKNISIAYKIRGFGAYFEDGPRGYWYPPCDRCGSKDHALEKCIQPCMKCQRQNTRCTSERCLSSGPKYPPCMRCQSVDHSLVECDQPCRKCHQIDDWCISELCVFSD